MERCQRAISRPLLGCECCVNRRRTMRRDRAGYRAGMRRVTILTIVATLVPVAIAFGGPSARVSAATVPAGFTDSLVTTFSQPTAVESVPDGRIVVLEQGGRVRAGLPGQAMPTVLTIPNICPGGERGLLGFTHDPGFLTNRLVYVYYTRDARPRPAAASTESAASRCQDVIDPASEAVLVDNISSVAGNHNGGDLDIGSTATSTCRRRRRRATRGADGRASNDAAQDLSLLNGKILRITLDGSRRPATRFSGAGTARCATRGNLPRRRRRVPGDLRLGPAQPVPDRLRPQRRRRPVLHQRRRPERPRGGRPRAASARDYGWNQSRGVLCPRAGPAVRGPRPASPIRSPTTRARSASTSPAGRSCPTGCGRADLDGGYLFADGGIGEHLPPACRRLRRLHHSVGDRAPPGSPTWRSRSTRVAARRSTTRSTATASCARSCGTVRSRRRPRRTSRSPRSLRRAPTTRGPGSAQWPVTCGPTRPVSSICLHRLLRCRRRSSTSPSRTTPGGGSSKPGRRVRCGRPRRWSTSCSRVRTSPTPRSSHSTPRVGSCSTPRWRRTSSSTSSVGSRRRPEPRPRDASCRSTPAA